MRNGDTAWAAWSRRVGGNLSAEQFIRDSLHYNSDYTNISNCPSSCGKLFACQSSHRGCTCNFVENTHRSCVPPRWNLSLPLEGLQLYEEAVKLDQNHRSCNSASPSLDAQPSCHSLLFHGKLSRECLRERNVTVASLPCVGSLFITGTGASGTAHTASLLNDAGFNFEAELHSEERSVFVSWLSRTDVWRLTSGGMQRAYYAGPAFAPEHMLPYINNYPQVLSDLGRANGLSRCLYQRVLLQVREPLAVIQSYLFILEGIVGFSVMADQLLARSGVFRSACDLPVAPTMHLSISKLSNRTARAPYVAYLAQHWWAWNTAALAAADGYYRVENTSLKQICALGGLNPARCAVKDNGRINHHGGSTSTRVPPVTWTELCKATGARRTGLVYDLATRLGYTYTISAAPPCIWP